MTHEESPSPDRQSAASRSDARQSSTATRRPVAPRESAATVPNQTAASQVAVPRTTDRAVERPVQRVTAKSVGAPAPSTPAVTASSNGHVNQPAGNRPPVRSTLPVEIPEFREIVEAFLDDLPNILGKLDSAWASGDYSELREVAHKLKGTGGTVGFREFTGPAETLQNDAAAQRGDRVEDLLREIREIADAIEMPVATAGAV